MRREWSHGAVLGVELRCCAGAGGGASPTLAQSEGPPRGGG